MLMHVRPFGIVSALHVKFPSEIRPCSCFSDDLICFDCHAGDLMVDASRSQSRTKEEATGKIFCTYVMSPCKPCYTVNAGRPDVR